MLTSRKIDAIGLILSIILLLVLRQMQAAVIYPAFILLLLGLYFLIFKAKDIFNRPADRNLFLVKLSYGFIAAGFIIAAASLLMHSSSLGRVSYFLVFAFLVYFYFKYDSTDAQARAIYWQIIIRLLLAMAAIITVI